MWFSSIYLKTLREVRLAMAGWGVGVGLLMLAVLAAVPALVATPQARASLVSLAGSFAWIAEPIKVDTPGGYATWKYGFTILIMALWPILACSRLLRGEEERGALDLLLAVPRGRVRVALEKLATVWTALLAMALLIGVLTFAGAARAQAGFGLGDALLFGLNLALICGVFGSLALLLAQFTRERRTAAGSAGGLLLLFVVLDMAHRVYPQAEWLSRLSPVYYYNLSKPLVPGYGANAGALVVLLALSVLLSGAAFWLFARRDIGGTVALPAILRRPERIARPERALPVNAWSLRSVYTRSLGALAGATAWWTVAIAGFAAWIVVIVAQTAHQLSALSQSSPLLKKVISSVGGSATTTNASLLSFLFLVLPVLVMAFAITQAGRWAADEEDGRLDLVLATPQPRLRVVLARYGALATAIIFMGVLTLVATALAAATSGLTLDGGHLAAATLSLTPLGLLVAALGYLLSGWLRTAVDTGLLSVVLALWFGISFLGPELGWPTGLLRLSALYYYGTPLLNGLPMGDTLAVLVGAVVLLTLASARFMVKDIAS